MLQNVSERDILLHIIEEIQEFWLKALWRVIVSTAAAGDLSLW